MDISSIDNLVAVQDKLKKLHTLKQDVILSADKVTFWRGELIVKNPDPVITEDGVTQTSGRYVLTDRFIDSIAGRLKLPAKYLREVHKTRTHVFDDILNGTLHEETYFDKNEMGLDYEVRKFPAYNKNSLVRLYLPTEGEVQSAGKDARGTARYFASDRFGIFDNDDALMAFLGGIQQAGFGPDDMEVTKATVTNNRMRIDVDLPGIQQAANDLLENYQPPANHGSFKGTTKDDPIVSVGLTCTNSEVGLGALAVYPVIRVWWCNNGWVLKHVSDAYKKHLGSKLEEGVIKYAADTSAKQAELVMLQIRDAVATYCDADFLAEQVTELSEKASKKITDPVETFEKVSKKLSFTESEHQSIFNHFITSGQADRAGGLTQAITSYVQTEEALLSIDRAHDLQMAAVSAMELV